MLLCTVYSCRCEGQRCCVVHVFALVFAYVVVFCFQAEGGIRDLVRSRGLGDVYKRQVYAAGSAPIFTGVAREQRLQAGEILHGQDEPITHCLLYTSDAADKRSRVDPGGRRIIKKKTQSRLRRERRRQERDQYSHS